MSSYIDTAVIIVFSVFIMLIGFLFARTGRNLKSFFAGGEAVPWFIGGLSLFMSFFRPVLSWPGDMCLSAWLGGHYHSMDHVHRWFDHRIVPGA